LPVLKNWTLSARGSFPRLVTSLALMKIAVHHLALACCAVEVETTISLDLPVTQGDFELVPAGLGTSPIDLSVLVIAGTVSRAAEPRLHQVWTALEGPKLAIAYGVCASSGGPYWDSYSVLASAAEVVPVSRFVPGCPPPRSTLVDAIVATASEFAGVKS
jgi:NADH-quinone oxidoreductase subunit B